MVTVEHVAAVEYLRKLRGGSQPVLVKADDGFLYVVKFFNNPQGCNLFFNEALGTEIFRSAGLAVPQWRYVEVSDTFLERYPQSWIETESGHRRPLPGLCFGSRFLSLRTHCLFEILPKAGFGRIQNRRDFWTAWVLDVFCEHTDNRQAIFVENETKYLKAYFVDHGHLFGGAAGISPASFLGSRFLDPRIYPNVTKIDADEICQTIKGIDLDRIARVAYRLPKPWKTESARLRLQSFLQRISNSLLLENTVRFILRGAEGTGRKNGEVLWRTRNTRGCEDLYAQVSPA